MTTTTLPDLSGFIGSGEFYRHWTGRLIYTEGIDYLAEQAGAHWLIDLVASHLVYPRVQQEPFQLWALKLDGKGGCVVTMRRDTGERPIVRQVVEYTDFPADVEWYACDNGQGHTMMLNSEY